MQVIIPRHSIRIYHYERQITLERRGRKLAESLSELRQCCLSFLFFFWKHKHCEDKNINFSLTMVDSSERKCREN